MERSYCSVGRSLPPAALVVLAVLADSQRSHGLALGILLLAVPVAALSALLALGDLHAHDDTLAWVQASLSALAVLLIVLSCAVRNSAVHGVPPLAVSAAVAVLAIFAVKAIAAAVPMVRRLSDLWPAKP